MPRGEPPPPPQPPAVYYVMDPALPSYSGVPHTRHRPGGRYIRPLLDFAPHSRFICAYCMGAVACVCQQGNRWRRTCVANPGRDIPDIPSAVCVQQYICLGHTALLPRMEQFIQDVPGRSSCCGHSEADAAGNISRFASIVQLHFPCCAVVHLTATLFVPPLCSLRYRTVQGVQHNRAHHYCTEYSLRLVHSLLVALPHICTLQYRTD